MYGENTKHHSNPYIQGTTVPCDIYRPDLGIITYAVRLMNKYELLFTSTEAIAAASMEKRHSSSK